MFINALQSALCKQQWLLQDDQFMLEMKRFFLLWQGFYSQCPQIICLMNFLHKFVSVEKRRSWGLVAFGRFEHIL